MLEAASLAACVVEVVVGEPALELVVECGPVAVDDREPGGCLSPHSMTPMVTSTKSRSRVGFRAAHRYGDEPG